MKMSSVSATVAPFLRACLGAARGERGPSALLRQVALPRRRPRRLLPARPVRRRRRDRPHRRRRQARRAAAQPLDPAALRGGRRRAWRTPGPRGALARRPPPPLSRSPIAPAPPRHVALRARAVALAPVDAAAGGEATTAADARAAEAAPPSGGTNRLTWYLRGRPPTAPTPAGDLGPAYGRAARRRCMQPADLYEALGGPRPTGPPRRRPLCRPSSSPTRLHLRRTVRRLPPRAVSRRRAPPSASECASSPPLPPAPAGLSRAVRLAPLARAPNAQLSTSSRQYGTSARSGRRALKPGRPPATKTPACSTAPIVPPTRPAPPRRRRRHRGGAIAPRAARGCVLRHPPARPRGRGAVGGRPGFCLLSSAAIAAAYAMRPPSW